MTTFRLTIMRYVHFKFSKQYVAVTNEPQQAESFLGSYQAVGYQRNCQPFAERHV